MKKRYKTNIPLFENGAIVDPMGQHNHPGKETIIPTQNGRITMQGVPYPVMGVDEFGNKQLMMPNKEYQFKGKRIHEIPLLQAGGRLVNQKDIPGYEKIGYKPIGNNQYVKNGAQLEQLKYAQSSGQQSGIEYEKWVKGQLQKGRSISDLVKMGYGTEQGLGLLAQGITPYSDTIRYETPKAPPYLNYQAFDINEGLVKGIRRGDTLFFQPNIPQNLRDIAALNFTDVQKSIPKNKIVTATRAYHSKKEGGVILPKAQMGIESFELNPSSFQSAFPVAQAKKPLINLGTGIETSEQGNTPDNTKYNIVDPNKVLSNKPDNSFMGLAFGKAVASAWGNRIANNRQQDSIQRNLADPFQAIPNITTNNEFLNEGNKVFQEGGELEDDDMSYLFQNENQQPEEEYVYDNFDLDEKTQELIENQDEVFTFDSEEDDSEEQTFAQPTQQSVGAVSYTSGNNNPGNIRSSSGDFANYSSYEEGKQALRNQLRLYQTGQTKNNVNPNSTLLEAMSVYAPASDNNNPQKYAEFIASKIGVGINTPISNIDIDKWADAIEIMEGNTKIKTKSSNVNINTVNDDLRRFYNEANVLFPGLVITSGTDGKHSSNSAHYDSDAIDIGANSSNREAYNKLKQNVDYFRRKHGIYILDEGDHLHISKSRKGKK